MSVTNFPIDLATVMRQLYDSEIGCTISSLYDAGWRVRVGWSARLGDELNGYVAEEQFRNDEFDRIARWLIAAACEHFPDSQFARAYRPEV